MILHKVYYTVGDVTLSGVMRENVHKDPEAVRGIYHTELYKCLCQRMQ